MTDVVATGSTPGAPGVGRRGRLESNALALMASSVLTGLLGIAYWILAERCYPTAQVGRASAVISTATMLSSLACLSLGGSYQRFLPLAGHRTRVLVVGGLGLTGAVALLLGTGFVLVGPSRDRLFATGLEAAVFPALVAVLTGYALLDPILIGLQQARTVAVKNVALSVLKLLPIPLLAYTATDLALFGSWGALALLVSLGVLVPLLRRGLDGCRDVPPALPPTRELWAFQGASFTMTAVLTATPLTVPLVVLSALGPECNAYYNLVAALGTAVSMLRANVLASYVVEAAQPGAPRAALTRRMLRLMALVCGTSAIGLAVFGPLLLRVVGERYAAAATPLMLLLAVEAVVSAGPAMYAAVAQIARRLRLLVVQQSMTVVLTVGGTLVLVPRVGLIGVGLASLGAQVVAFAVIALPLWRLVGAMRDPTDPPAVPGGKAPAPPENAEEVT